jgi:hypothetical protein
MKKGIFPALLLAVICGLSACDKVETTAADATTTTAAATVAGDTTTAATTAAAGDSVQRNVYPEVTNLEYSADVMVEIIELTSSDSMTDAMNEMNNEIQATVVLRVQEYYDKRDEAESHGEEFYSGIDVYAYSFTDDDYIQIYNTVFEYPTYGNTGEVYGFVYDIKNDDFIPLSEYMDKNGISPDGLLNDIQTLYAETNPTDTIEGINPKTFNLAKGPEGEYNYSILFEMEVTSEGAYEPYKRIYAYSPADRLVYEMNSEQLFDPASIDQYEEPVHGQEGWPEYYADFLDNLDAEPDSDSAPEYDSADAEYYSILQGDYYFEGDTNAGHLTFYGTQNADAYYASGSYEASFTISYLESALIEEVGGDTYHELVFELYDDNGNFAYYVKVLDIAPGVLDFYNAGDGEYKGEYININI